MVFNHFFRLYRRKNEGKLKYFIHFLPIFRTIHMENRAAGKKWVNIAFVFSSRHKLILYFFVLVVETLRKHPVVPLIPRVCVKKYQIPGTTKIIEKGTTIFLPVYSLHRDAKYYKDPLVFDPNRFSADNFKEFNQLNRPYIPFGDGPRNCIGETNKTWYSS